MLTEQNKNTIIQDVLPILNDYMNKLKTVTILDIEYADKIDRFSKYLTIRKAPTPELSYEKLEEFIDNLKYGYDAFYEELCNVCNQAKWEENIPNKKEAISNKQKDQIRKAFDYLRSSMRYPIDSKIYKHYIDLHLIAKKEVFNES